MGMGCGGEIGLMNFINLSFIQASVSFRGERKINYVGQRLKRYFMHRQTPGMVIRVISHYTFCAIKFICSGLTA